MRTSSRWMIVALLLVAGSARAETEGESLKRAKAAYQSGIVHYNLSEYKEALVNFIEAYRMRADPVFLFNIAQCYRLSGDPENAVTYYRNYLREKPKAPNREAVEKYIAEAEVELAKRKPPEPEPKPEPKPEPPKVEPKPEPPPPPPVVERPKWYKNWLGVGLLGGGVLVAAVGGAMLGLVGSAVDDANRATTRQAWLDARSRGETFQWTGVALLGVGGAAAIAGAVVLGLGARERPAKTAWIMPTLGGLSVGGTF